MEVVQTWLLPVVQLLAVIGLAILLVSVVVTGMLRALAGVARRGWLPGWRLWVALRILVGFQADRPSWWHRVVPVSTQNFIAMVSTAIGVWALVVVLSVMGGFEADLKGKILRQTPSVRLEPRLAVEDEDAPARVARLVAELRSRLPQGHAVEAYVEGEAMIVSSVNMSPGMALLGLSPDGLLESRWLVPSADPKAIRVLRDPLRLIPDRDMGFRRLPRKGRESGTAPLATTPLAEDGAPPGDEEPLEAPGAMPPIGGPEETRGRVLPAILLGEELARGLSVGAGDEVTVVVPDGDVGPTGLRPRTRTFRVAGTFASGLYEHDLRTAYLNEREAEVLFLLGAPNRVAILDPDLKTLDRTAAIARETLERHGGGEVLTVQETNRSLFSALRIEKVAMFLVLGLVILVAGFNIFGSLVLVAMEKSRDMAVLRSLGATHQGIRDLFLALGGSIGAVGLVAGLVLGLGTCAYIQVAGIRLPAEYYLRTLPVEVRGLEVGLVALAALGSALVATLYPALSVARPSPSDGLRND